MTESTTTGPAIALSSETLKAKEAALARVHTEQAKLDKLVPDLVRAKKTASARLDTAQLAVFVATGTPGFEDDRAVEASVAKEQAALDSVCEQLAAAEDRIKVLKRAEVQLHREIGETQGALLLAHIGRVKTALSARIEKSSVVFAEMVRDIATLRTLEGVTTWAADFDRVITETAKADLPALIRNGQSRADRVRAGEEVAP